MHTKLSVNSSKTKIMLVKSQKRDKSCILYNNEPLEYVESFKYLGLEVPSNHRWNECATRRLEAGKRAYYAFENTCNLGDIKCWVLKKYLFDILVTPVLLYGVEVWGSSIPKSTWKEFENLQKHFLQSFYKLRNKRHTLSFLRQDHFPLRSWSWKGLLHTCLRLKKVPHIDFLELHLKQAKRSKRCIKAKICVPVGCKIFLKWFGRWNATHLLHDASLDSSVNKAFLQCQCSMTWDKCGGSRFTHYTTHVAPNYKSIFFAERGNCTHRYMLEPIPLFAIRTIASMQLNSHAFPCETGIGHK